MRSRKCACGNMASKKKKTKLSRAELKKIASKKGKSSATRKEAKELAQEKNLLFLPNGENNTMKRMAKSS